MVLLKAAEFNQATTSNQVFNLNDIAAEAQNILETARRESESLLRQARQDIERDRQQAREDGYRAGHEQGARQGREEGHEQALQEAQKEFAQSSAVVCESLQSICAEFYRSKKHLVLQAEQKPGGLFISLWR